jgi:hypothetical protein
MKAENKAFLKEFKPFHDKIGLGGTIHMNLEDRKRMQDIIRAEWDPTYVTCITCNEGVIDLLKMAYNNYQLELEKELITLSREPADAPVKIVAPKPKKNDKAVKF